MKKTLQQLIDNPIELNAGVSQYEIRNENLNQLREKVEKYDVGEPSNFKLMIEKTEPLSLSKHRQYFNDKLK